MTLSAEYSICIQWRSEILHARHIYIYTSHISELEVEQREEAMSALIQVKTRALVRPWKADSENNVT
jgi:hypothetical protein